VHEFVLGSGLASLDEQTSRELIGVERFSSGIEGRTERVI
jgi:hypothetical protein